MNRINENTHVKIMNRMKELISKISVFKITAFGLLLAPALLSCQDAKADKDNNSTEVAYPRPDEALTRLTRTLAEGDAPGFASLCVYPVPRPYPLKDIEDSVSMVDYFHILVDDSLISIFRNSNLDDWESYGWRGWSIVGSTPLWYDEGVQLIDYVSPAEAGFRRILAREEIMSLAPQFREGWSPVMTLVETDGDRVFRIDSKGDTFRLMGFDNADNLDTTPTMLLTGTVSYEGSANLPQYTFSNAEGVQAEFIPDAEPAEIFLRHPGKEDRCKVRPAYWRDIRR